MLGISRAKAQRSQRIKLPDLACLASFRLRSRQAWREQVPVSIATLESLRKLRKLSTIVTRNSMTSGGKMELKYSEILQRNAELSKSLPTDRFEIAVLSNVEVFQLKEILEYALRVDNIPAAVTTGDYDNI